MVKAELSRRARARVVRGAPQMSFTQSELWESLERPVETADAIRALAALRERFEQALMLEHDRAAG